MEKALPVLAVTPNYQEAAKILGCNKYQIYEWLKNEEFKENLESLRTEIVNEAVSKMKSHVTKAVDNLALLMDDDCPKIRRGACNDILNHVGRFMELHEIQQRIGKLEKILS